MSDDGDDPVEAAAALAAELAPDLGAVVLTLYPDADTLELLRPGETDVATANAATRAVARELAAEGVQIFVQRADRGAFRRWLAAQEDPTTDRHGWIDRARLLRGAEAWRALGLKPPPAPAPPRFPAAPGPSAEALLAAHADPDSDAFDILLRQLVVAGRGDVLDLAWRKVAAAQSDENAAELLANMRAAAGADAVGPSGWAELIGLPVALPTEGVPDAEALAAGLVASGALDPSEEWRFLPGWRAPEAVAALSPVAVRSVLDDLVAGREPAALPPGDTDDLAQSGFGVLVALRLDWSIPSWAAIEALGDLPDEVEEAEDSPAARLRARALDRWRSTVASRHAGCVPLDPVPLAEVAEVIAEFLEEATGEVAGLAEIAAFIGAARDAAGEEEVVCRPAVAGETLELTLYTARGRFLDRREFPPELLPGPAEAMLGMLGTMVRVVRDAP